MKSKESGSGWSLYKVAQSSGRSVSHVHQAVHSGLLPQRIIDAMPTARRVGAQLQDELYEALVDVFSVGVATPRVSRLLREDPTAVMRAAESLALLALLSGASRSEPTDDDGDVEAA